MKQGREKHGGRGPSGQSPGHEGESPPARQRSERPGRSRAGDAPRRRKGHTNGPPAVVFASAAQPSTRPQRVEGGSGQPPGHGRRRFGRWSASAGSARRHGNRAPSSQLEEPRHRGRRRRREHGGRFGARCGTHKKRGALAARSVLARRADHSRPPCRWHPPRQQLARLRGRLRPVPAPSGQGTPARQGNGGSPSGEGARESCGPCPR